MKFLERLYVVEVAKGLAITMRHFLRNLFRLRPMMTVNYPEERLPVPIHYRAEHRLMHRQDGTPRCTACQLCETICPSKCIHIEPTETAAKGVEKMPLRFEIDLLRCVVCGLCVEACPCDAIRMDTGQFENATFNGPKLIYDLQKLMNNHPPGADKISKAIY